MINKNNLVVVGTVSKSLNNLEISGVYFKEDKETGAITTAATDNYQLVEVKNTLGFNKFKSEYPTLQDYTLLDHLPEEGLILPPDAIKKIIKNLAETKKAGKETPVLNNAVFVNSDSKDSFKIATTNLSSVDVMAAVPIEGKYPDYKQIMPEKDDNEITTTIDISRLKSIATILASMDIKAVEGIKSIQMITRPGNKSVQFKANTDQGQEVNALIMPINK